MASNEVTGKTKYELAEMRSEFSEKERNKWYEFEEWYCLAKIPRQPDEYDGPDRFCASTNLKYRGLCKHHGGAIHKSFSQNLDKLAPMKHGMEATNEHLEEDFEEQDQALYDWVMEKYPEAYGIDVEEDVDPSSEYTLHGLAMEMVRAERGESYILKEGEKQESPVRDAEGQLVVNKDGEVVTEKSEHYLASMINRQRNLIMKIEKHLGISRKQRLDAEDAAETNDAITTIAEIGAEVIDPESKEYDPERYEPDEDSE